MRAKSRAFGSATAPLWLLFLTSLAALDVASARAGVSRPPEGDCGLFSLPWAVSEPVYRLDDAVPEAVADFRARNGRDWILYVDPLLGTARFAAPLAELPLLDAPADGAPLDRAATAAAAARFLDANRELFGAEAAELSEPRFQALGGGLLVVYGQRTRSGLPVRGATLRLHVGADGTLRYVKSFLARGLSDAWDASGHAGLAFLSAEEAAAPALAAGWELAGQRLEVAFDGGSLERLLPLWRLSLAREGTGLVEELRDARTGALVESCEVVKHFDVVGQGTGIAAPLRDLFSPPGNIAEGVRQPLEGFLVTTTAINGVPPPGLLLTMTDTDGLFQGSLPGEPLDSLALLGSLATSLSAADLAPCADRRDLRGCLALTVGPYDASPPFLCNFMRIPGLECVAGVEVIQPTNAPYVFVINEGGRRGSPAAVLTSFWLQSFVHSRRVLAWSEERIADAFHFVPAAERPLRLLPLRIEPAETRRPQSPFYIPGIRQFGTEGRIFAPLTVIADDAWRGGEPRAAEPFPMMPTTTAHEVAHHVLWELGALGYTTQVEEGLADALAALANDEPRLGWTSPVDRGPAGYSLEELAQGIDPNRYVSELRAAVGNGFWEVRRRLERERGNPAHAGRLLLRWVRTNAGADPADRTYNDPAVLLEELLALNPALVAEYSGRHDVDATILRGAFQHCHFLSGTAFVRGDANLDEAVDIADAVAVLGYLFAGVAQPHDCRDAMDADDNGQLEVTDAVALLGYLFLGAGPPSPPFPGCGVDPTRTDPYCCSEFVCPR